MRRDVFQAIADPTRRRMLGLLAERERPVMELVDHFDITQPSVSQHLRVLRDVGLVSIRKAGRQRIYQLNSGPIRNVADWVRQFERFWDERLDRLEGYLAGQRRNASKHRTTTGHDDE